MNRDPQIDAFLSGSPFAVVGASTDRNKYGNRVLRAYLQNHMPVTPVNPTADQVEGLPAVRSLREIDHPLHGISVITPPAVTEQVVQDAIAIGVPHIWMQPGAESTAAVAVPKKPGSA